MKKFKFIINEINDKRINFDFRTKSNTLVAKTYNRIVIGKRGPYVEFDELCFYNLWIPFAERWRKNNEII